MKPPLDTPPSTPASMAQLPAELVLEVAGKLLAAADLNSLAVTCRRLYMTVNPLLYQYNISEQNADAVLWACETNTIATLERLREQGARFDFVVKKITRAPQYPPVRFAPVHVAAKHGRIEVLAWLLDHGAKPDVLSQAYCGCSCFPDMFPLTSRDLPSFVVPQWSPLHTAVCRGQNDAAIFLIERGTSLGVSQRSEDVQTRLPRSRPVTDIDVTILHTAAATNNVALIDYLVKQGLADISCVDRAGYTPIHYASISAHTSEALPRLQQLKGTNAWHYGPRSPLQLAVTYGAFGCASLLLRAGHDDEQWDTDPILAHATQTQPKHWWGATLSAWQRQRDEFIGEILARGHAADIILDVFTLITPLHVFANTFSDETSPELFEALLAAGADPERPDDQGRSAFYRLAHSFANDFSLSRDAPPDDCLARSRRKFILFLEHGAKLDSRACPLAEDGDADGDGAGDYRPAADEPQTPLEALCYSCSGEPLPAWRRQLVDDLVEYARRNERQDTTVS